MKSNSRVRILAATIATLSLTGSVFLAPSPAQGDILQPKVVSENPVDYTPHVLDGAVHAITVVGDTAIVGGEFNQIKEAPSDSPTIDRKNLFAFNIMTGKIDTGFTPVVDDVVRSLAPGENDTVYVGGHFKMVNGTEMRRLARLKVADGTADPSFNRVKINFGRLTAMARRGSNLYIGGSLDSITDTVTGTARKALARLDAETGAVDPTFDIKVSEPRTEGSELTVKNLAVDPADSKLVISGTFTKVDDQDRPQVAMVDLGTPPQLSSWATDKFAPTCSPEFDTYMRGMDFSPDGKYFVITTTGGAGFGLTTMCMSASRWEADHVGPGQIPTWTNYTGGDTLLSVSVTGAAVYVGGHQRWMDNPRGNGNAGPGAVERTGIAAIHPETGKSRDIPWNPTRTRGVGAEALIATPDGLLVGSDTDQLGHEYHGRIGMFPLD
ncbi:delta-60 repeat domain-containing protein [Actinomadura coerulea]|uniref:delta-60 repeat domain-containing protein n=1 Tax=Actinomadura coerulea TaxID=46159 RepID=UPI003435D2F7